MSKNILVTGGAGYIGSHTCIALIEAGYDVVVYDNLSNSSREAIIRAEKIVGAPIAFVKGDIRDKQTLKRVFADHDFFGVIHFAGLKAVGESVEKPLMYYDNNVSGTICLLEVMKSHQVHNLVFSSSATVYGDPKTLPIDEQMPRSATNPYGQSKLSVEHILEDLARADDAWHLLSLRYFNPVGAHRSGRIGEDPNGIPNNLMPYISQVAVGKRDRLGVFGNDYDTPDGTGVRDFIHVTDLARGHVAALDYIAETADTAHPSQSRRGFEPINLGTGRGSSVLELIDAFIKASGKAVPYEFAPRRAGDIAACYASANKAKQLLGWEAVHDIHAMCQDTWRWQKNNPNGYQCDV